MDVARTTEYSDLHVFDLQRYNMLWLHIQLRTGYMEYHSL